jgi:pyruvate-formate lyase
MKRQTRSRKKLFDGIEITNIIEWLIAILFGIGGWYVAIKSTISQQRKERYNDLIQDFHSFIYEFRSFLQELVSKKNDKNIIQGINSQIKFIYYKAQNLDRLAKNKDNAIYQKVNKAGEEFYDLLLDPDIESALISSEENVQTEEKKKNLLRFADKFIEVCYSAAKFNMK